EQSDNHVIEFLGVQVHLDFNGLHLYARWVFRGPSQYAAISSTAVEVHVHEARFFLCNDGGLEPSHSRQFIPQIIVLAEHSVLADVTGGGSVQGLDAVEQFTRHCGLDGNVDGGAHNLFPFGAKHDM